MCCFIDEKYTAKKVAELKNKCTHMVGYKLLTRDGKALIGSHQYGPGTHELETNLTQYSYSSNTWGFHFYPTLKIAQKNKRKTTNRVIVKVMIPVRDILGLETPGSRKEEQGVANSLFITKEDWLKAGFKIKRNKV